MKQSSACWMRTAYRHSMSCGTFSSARFSLNTYHSAEGIVSVMCCQRVCGSLAVCVAIHWSVACLPHVGQNRLLQLKHTLLRCGQAPFEQQWLA
ncbi:hypothetical protein B0G57_1421 [Trinickia symbiotica]|nr:hypothetical protein [Trinickia symbiotica]PPK41058.1 hypothetical protein B0G57_1421 [Trinickia symbiotica]